MPLRTVFLRPAVAINPFDGSLASYYASKAVLWAPYYIHREQQLGSTPTLVNFGDTSLFGAVSAATGTGKSFSTLGLAPTWTPSTTLNSWATPLDLAAAVNWQGIAPILTFDGTNDDMNTPDAVFFTPSKASNTMDTAFSVGMWVKFSVAGAIAVLMSKSNSTFASDSEWMLTKEAADGISLNLRDPSVPVNSSSLTDAAVAIGSWLFIVATYDGGGGATAGSGITIYVNGASVAVTATNQATYVAMENGAQVVSLGSRATANKLNGQILGGPFGPFFVQDELSSFQVKNLYDVERIALGV